MLPMENSMQTDGATRIQVHVPPGTSFDEKWDILKPILKQLWIDENKKLADLIDIMRVEYGFIAEEPQYKYHFRKWKWKKNISTPKKEAMCGIRHSRAEIGKATVFRSELLGKNIEEKKLRRYLKETTRSRVAMTRTKDLDPRELKILLGTSFQLSESIFLNWTVPHGAMKNPTTQSPGSYGPSPMSISTPSDIVVTTPAGDAASSPNNAPSPLTKLHNRKMTVDRAQMFVEGRYEALVRSMSKEEKLSMSTWLYQFWLYGFKTAKFWGRGPREWNAETLELGRYSGASPVLIPNTPENDSGMETHRAAIRGTPNDTNVNTANMTSKPSNLCCWSIHYKCSVWYEQRLSRSPSPEPDPDLCNENALGRWPKSWEEPPFEERLLNGLASNSFSDVISNDLPIALAPIVQASQGVSTALLQEAYGFSIMARNIEETTRLQNQMSVDESRDLSHRLKPVHLATTFMDGAKTCCRMLNTLLFEYNDECGGLFRSAERNSLGHTVMDNLMIAILKAHTSITPGAVDDGLRDEKRFPGEEVDICGRWDADSDCIRELLANGRQDIPFSWKHKFCHTSAQTICHCIAMIEIYSRDIADSSSVDIPSGLYVKRCFKDDCGLKMQLTPLHTVVLVAFCLAQYGHEDEDLFGMLAVLLSVLRYGANPTRMVDLDVTALLSIEDTDNINVTGCHHEKLSSTMLAERVPLSILEKWSSRKRIGWEIICHVLRRSEEVWTGCEDYAGLRYKYNEFEVQCKHESTFGDDRTLAVLWGAVQTELLTYRRLKEGDGWVSPNFNMESLLDGLQSGNHVDVGLVEKDLMTPICNCGTFIANPFLPRAEQVSKSYFSNLDDWSRTTFIPVRYVELVNEVEVLS